MFPRVAATCDDDDENIKRVGILWTKDSLARDRP